jgi:hypothetical protein
MPSSNIQHPTSNIQHPLQCGEVKLATFFLIPFLIAGAELRLGLVGGDSAEAIAFTQILNDASHPDHIPGARVVAAYRGGRVDKTGEELRAKWKVEITPDVGSLCRRVDAVLIGSGDAAARLDQIKVVIASGKPMFLASPLAATLEDGRLIGRLAKEAGVAWFSASGIRFGEAATNMKYSDTLGADSWGPGPIEQRYDAVEMLYAVMGAGCEEVTRISADGADVVAGRWRGGRVGSVRSLGPQAGSGAVVFRSNGVVQSRPRVGPDYRSLLVEIVKFFEIGQPPVSSEETLEILAFVDAAQRSKAAGGGPTKLR